MQIPDFSQFLADMGDNYFANAIMAHEDTIKGTFYPFQAGGASELVTAIVSCSSSIALDILKDYHEWLRKQLARQA